MGKKIRSAERSAWETSPPSKAKKMIIEELKDLVVYIMFIIILIINLLVFVPNKCLLDGHAWKEFQYKGEKRRKCGKCGRVEFWNMDIADVIESITGKPGQGQWNHIRYLKKDKK